MRLFIVSGISGAGKSIVLNALEDLGFYCIDNLPAGLLPAFAKELLDNSREHYQHAAVGIDARNLSSDLSRFPEILDELRQQGLDCQIIFLDADDNILVTRFSETRRRHPLTRAGSIALLEAIREERQLLEPLSANAHLSIDTSFTNVHELRDMVVERVGQNSAGALSILFESFGFKHGVPVDADFVFDVRCLANPHWDPQLRSFTGQSREVATFLDNQPQVEQMFGDISQFLDRWLPEFQVDNRPYMTVAIGCTGGQHRSVYLVERLARHFGNGTAKILIRHRELP